MRASVCHCACARECWSLNVACKLLFNFKSVTYFPNHFFSYLQCVQSCTRVANGVKISGDITKLNFKGNVAYLKPCTELVYGFMGGDHHYALTSVAGCSVGYKHGHVGAVIGAFLDPPSGDHTKNGQNVK